MKGTKEYVTLRSQGHKNCSWKVLADSKYLKPFITTVANLHTYLKISFYFIVFKKYEFIVNQF